jgi:hypothetical protein
LAEPVVFELAEPEPTEPDDDPDAPGAAGARHFSLPVQGGIAGQAAPCGQVGTVSVQYS